MPARFKNAALDGISGGLTSILWGWVSHGEGVEIRLPSVVIVGGPTLSPRELRHIWSCYKVILHFVIPTYLLYTTRAYHVFLTPGENGSRPGLQFAGIGTTK